MLAHWGRLLELTAQPPKQAHLGGIHGFQFRTAAAAPANFVTLPLLTVPEMGCDGVEPPARIAATVAV